MKKILLFLLAISCAGDDTLNDSSQIETQLVDSSQANLFEKFNPICEGRKDRKDIPCISDICELRANYNLEVVSCKIGRLWYDEIYCSDLDNKYKKKLAEIENNSCNQTRKD